MRSAQPLHSEEERQAAGNFGSAGTANGWPEIMQMQKNEARMAMSGRSKRTGAGLLARIGFAVRRSPAPLPAARPALPVGIGRRSSRPCIRQFAGLDGGEAAARTENRAGEEINMNQNQWLNGKWCPGARCSNLGKTTSYRKVGHRIVLMFFDFFRINVPPTKCVKVLPTVLGQAAESRSEKYLAETSRWRLRPERDLFW